MASPIGFSTGALALSDFRAALRMLDDRAINAAELSALRVEELVPLVQAAPSLDLSGFRHISVHAPSRFSASQERSVIDGLHTFIARGWPIVLHPDAIHDWGAWRVLGGSLMIENMDKRKTTGRTVDELGVIFEWLPEARLCFDIAHARQFDGSMTEAYHILTRFGGRIGQVHISEVSSRSTHERISRYAAIAFRQVARLIPADAPIIIESQVSPEEIESEIQAARAALQPVELRRTA